MRKKLIIALAGNANVGKSVIFNQLTGLHQHIGNWPGKTVEKADGSLVFRGYKIDIVDLPGIYSLTTFSIEEIVSREFIAVEKPDVVINILDASILERNLFFTLQLIELGMPLIIGLNQMDIAKKKGINIDCKKLQKLLGVPVIPTVAITGRGVHELLDEAIAIFESKRKIKPNKIKYGKEIEDRIKKITALLKRVQINYPVRYITIKLLEDDEEIKKMVESADPKIMTIVEKYARELERIHGHTVRFIIASERYNVANRLTQHSIRQIPPKIMFSERLDKITLHKVFGYPIMVIIILTIFLIIFKFGSFISGILENFFSNIELTFQSLFGTSVFTKLILGGVLNGLFAGIAIVIPYILPFYFILGLLEDSGYLTRIAFLVDTLMHKIGLHGKAFIPLMLGYGCNVPACLGCKIMETRKERFLAVFLTTLIPCAARTVIILGLVGAFVGMKWALALYIFNLIIIFVLGRLTFKILPGEPMGLIMEMHDYKIPHLKTIIKQTWFRLKEFIIIAFPFIIVGSFIIKILEITNLLEPISNAMSPITVWWLGLPAITGITLIFGILRKELILIMLATLLGTTNFALALTPVQMMVFAIVSMLYIPCIATIAVLVKELKWKKALYITVFEIAFAIFIGGLAYRVLSIVM